MIEFIRIYSGLLCNRIIICAETCFVCDFVELALVLYSNLSLSGQYWFYNTFYPDWLEVEQLSFCFIVMWYEFIEHSILFPAQDDEAS